MRKLYQWKLPSFQAHFFVKEQLVVTPFYISNVTVESIKNALEYKNAFARLQEMFWLTKNDEDVTLNGNVQSHSNK